MKRLVNGVEADLEPGDDVEIVRSADRLLVRTDQGTFSAISVLDGDARLVSYKGRQYKIERMARTKSAAVVGSGRIVAPMPGLLVDILVSTGQPVKKGDRLLVLEAMKVQQPFVAPFDGVVQSLPIRGGEQVEEGTLLAVLEPVATGGVEPAHEG